MAGGLFPRIKTWVSTEDVVFSDLNGEFDNIINNLVPLMIDGYSVNVAQMQVTADPGAVGSESLATTLGGELARLRFLIHELSGETQWYTAPASSLKSLANALGTAALNNRLVSGRVLTTSSQPAFLVPDGSARTIKLKGASTNFLYYINGAQYTISSDVTITSLTAAPSTNNTALVNDTAMSQQDWTKYSGENGQEITIDVVGSGISALAGQFAAFKVVHGGNTEYFTAYVETNKLTRARRSNFFDSADAPLTRIKLSDDDTITLMKLSWIYAKTDGTLTVSYTNPVYAKTAPTSPANGDYWFDLTNNTWMLYNVSSFVSANATIVGYCFQNTTATIGARSFEFFLGYDDVSNVEVIYNTASQVTSRFPGAQASIWGFTIRDERNLFVWDMTVNLDSGVTEAASTFYYFYITQGGDPVISDVRPQFREEIRGWYHPHQSWRCFGSSYNDGSQNLGPVNSFFTRGNAIKVSESHTASSNIEVTDRVIFVDGTSATTQTLPSAAYCTGQSLTFLRTDNTLANVVTLHGFASETIRGSVTYKMCQQNESVTILSDGLNWRVVGQYFPAVITNAGTMTIGAVTTPPTKGTIGIDEVQWSRVGRYAQLIYQYETTAAGSAANGSGDYLYTLPTGLVADTTIIPALTTATTGFTVTPLGKTIVPFSKAFVTNGTNRGDGWAQLYSTTQMRIAVWQDAGAPQIHGSAYYGLAPGGGLMVVYINAMVPMVNWEY